VLTCEFTSESWINLPELRVMVSEKMDKLLEKVVESGVFTSKADLARFAMIDYLERLGLLQTAIGKSHN
jgi:Arc/MetJ-type ribon-helix-helix transcriptional regulator